MGLILKVLSGPHSEAEFDVPSEEVIIGADDGCDVIISDVLIADRHAKFEIQGNQIFMTPLDGNIFIDGKLLREPTLIDNFKFITIGSTHMMIGEAESEIWSTLSPDQFPELEKIEEKAELFNSEDGVDAETIEDNSNSTKKPETKIKKISSNSKKSNSNDGIEVIKLVNMSKKQLFIRYIMIFVACFAIALATSIAVVLVKINMPEDRVIVESVEEKIKKAIDDLNFKHKIKVSKIEGENVSIVGYVKTMQESIEIKKTAQNITDALTIKVFNMEKLLSSAKELVDQSKQTVVLQNSENFGEITATGYVRKQEIWNNLKSEISAIKGILKIQDDVLTKDSATELAKEVLEKFKLNNNLSIRTNDAGIEISGTISDDERNIWTQVKDDLQKKFKKKAQLSFQVRVSSDRNLTIEKFFGGKVDSVNFNKQGLDWINIKNGSKYFQGSALPSGYIVEKIEQDSITIKNAEEVIKLDLEWI